jgi:hypothetical protein
LYQKEVEEIEGGGVDPDAYLTGAGLRGGGLGQYHLFRFAEG